MVINLNQDLQYVRVGAVVPNIRIADVDYNVKSILQNVKKAVSEGVQVIVFPEMSVTGYTIGDLVQQQALLGKAVSGLTEIVKKTASLKSIIIVGMPVALENRIFNCAAVLNAGKILGLIPKSYLPGYKEFYEDRWFTPAAFNDRDMIEIAGQSVCFGTDLLFRVGALQSAVIGVEICEDLWVPLAPHEYQSLAGANILINLSASNEILGKADWRRMMVASESGRCLAAYCYTSSGIGESSNDLVYSAHSIIAENGTIQQESNRLASDSQIVMFDIDVERLTHDRRIQTSFHDTERQSINFKMIEADVTDITISKIHRRLNAHPFVPNNPLRRAERCREIFSMQTAGLSQKLNGAVKKHVVIGVSGGLDSTLALLVAVKTMDSLKLPRQNIHAFSLPGFGTTSRTAKNAAMLCKALGTSFEKIDISETCEKHLKDINHSHDHEDIVFENVQARYRTELLFNIANHFDGIVLGTGDLTEIALGWATFSGDHISHYHINASVPKTLVKYVVEWVAEEEMAGTGAPEILRDILKTPISPELLRPKKGRILQKSEDIIGPVELADYFLYPFVRYGIMPGKILFLANETNKRDLFERRYSLDDLHKWLVSFINRFFANQFKRTCLPEGPKVGSVSLSPRGDWRMPSDASAGLWLNDLETMFDKLRSSGK